MITSGQRHGRGRGARCGTGHGQRGTLVGVGLLFAALAGHGCEGREGNVGGLAAAGTTSGTSGDGGEATEGETAGIRFDLGPGSGGHQGEDGDPGCRNVDFLFVVDNSGSMGDEQANLANSFPRFMDVIQSTLLAQDYRIMAVDTDATGSGSGSSNCSTRDGQTHCDCEPAPGCCNSLCGTYGADTCNGLGCDEIPGSPCDSTLGAGKVFGGDGTPCGIEGGNRFMLEGQTDLAGTFSCAAQVGTWGSGDEQPMGATLEATSDALNGAGACNEGFLRDDAILVVTFITDEDDRDTPGDPEAWYQALVAAKGGNADAVVVLGLMGDAHLDGGLPGGPCDEEAAAAAPTLQAFVDRWTYGSAGAVCAPDFSPFFEEAVSVIDAACDVFVPPG